MWIVSFKIILILILIIIIIIIISIISVKKRFLSMLFLIFEKVISKNNCGKNFKIHKYAFFNI